MKANLLQDLKQTEHLAARLASAITFPMVLTFSGDLGVGKTSFIRGLLKSLGVTVLMKSPTFSLVESYEVHHGLIHHFDLYRIQNESELDDIGFREYFGDNALCCIEWPERVQNFQAWTDLMVAMSFQGMFREIRMSAVSARGHALLSRLEQTS